MPPVKLALSLTRLLTSAHIYNKDSYTEDTQVQVNGIGTVLMHNYDELYKAHDCICIKMRAHKAANCLEAPGHNEIIPLDLRYKWRNRPEERESFCSNNGWW